MQQDSKHLAPFSCTYTSNIPELILNLRISLLISTYQAGKLIVISPNDTNKMTILPRSFQKPMGVAVSGDGEHLAIATKEEIIVSRNSSQLAWHYPKKPQTYDAMYMPRMTLHTNALDIHDLEWVNNEIYGVNTLFSCLCRFDANFNFTPIWKPPFISKISSEDRCHLNGMALEGNTIRYATAFGTGDSFQSWRENIMTDGILMDVVTGEILLKGLPMPHSPRMIGDKLYILLSGTGGLLEYDPQTGKSEEIKSFDNFVRGMSHHGEFLFIAHSRLRQNSSTFAKLEIPNKEQQAGIIVFHLPTRAIAGNFTFHASVDEIYDVKVLPKYIRPNILNTQSEIYKHEVEIPEMTFWARGHNKS